MRLVVQRVKNAKVIVLPSGMTVGKIGKGVFILVGIGKDDDASQAERLAEKVSKLRLISDEKGKMNLSVKETDSEVLVVSQFTLYADTSGGNRPSFINAAMPDEAKLIFDEFVRLLKKRGLKVKTGKFGAYMEIDAVLDGPVTILF